MGIYLGQLPPAEVARLKAELAETITANFCYPRFFDYRTESLRMRPVDRAKRQEVWLYLSSVDFTSWNRVDLMSPDFQRSIERLFIQFVQRNRSFFGEQGRKRMSDIRMLITSASTSVVQGLRNHVTGQRQDRQSVSPFGSPRQTVSWTASGKGRSEPTWEHIAASTLLLQQQLQEVRGEAKSPQVGDALVSPATAGASRRTVSRTGAPRTEQEVQLPPSSKAAPYQSTHVTTSPLQGPKSTTPLNPASLPNVATQRVVPPPTPVAPAASVVPPTPIPVRKQESVPSFTLSADVPVVAPPLQKKSTEPIGISHVSTPGQSAKPPQTMQPAASAAMLAPTSPLAREHTQATHGLSQTTAPTAPALVVPPSILKHENRDSPVMQIGDDDLAIFEQLRHQLTVWLRVESIHMGLETMDQTPAQLLDLLRQQDRYDETRLQVVSTLLNLSTQVIKNGRVSVLDYKQALMFHLMHTRRQP